MHLATLLALSAYTAYTSQGADIQRSFPLPKSPPQIVFVWGLPNCGPCKQLLQDAATGKLPGLAISVQALHLRGYNVQYPVIIYRSPKDGKVYAIFGYPGPSKLMQLISSPQADNQDEPVDTIPVDS